MRGSGVRSGRSCRHHTLGLDRRDLREPHSGRHVGAQCRFAGPACPLDSVSVRCLVAWKPGGLMLSLDYVGVQAFAPKTLRVGSDPWMAEWARRIAPAVQVVRSRGHSVVRSTLIPRCAASRAPALPARARPTCANVASNGTDRRRCRSDRPSTCSTNVAATQSAFATVEATHNQHDRHRLPADRGVRHASHVAAVHPLGPRRAPPARSPVASDRAKTVTPSPAASTRSTTSSPKCGNNDSRSTGHWRHDHRPRSQPVTGPRNPRQSQIRRAPTSPTKSLSDELASQASRIAHSSAR